MRRFRLDHADALKIAVLSVDPTRRKTGGALLGDRIRMNAIHGENVFMRSLATRGTGSEISAALADAIAACRAAGYALVIVETAGIGQGDAAIVPHVDASLYVMTPEFGAASQLEKIDMLDFADAVAINKFERRGAEDARRDVARQMVRNREAFGVSWETMPVFGTSAATFNDDGVTALYQHLRNLLSEDGLPVIFLGGSREEAFLSEVRAHMRTPFRGGAGGLELLEMAAVLRRARAFVGNDNGPMHIAAALGTLVVALFGPSDPQEWGPRGTGHRVIHKEGYCSPCIHPGCVRGEQNCLRIITVDEVAEAVRALLGRAAGFAAR